MERNLLELFTRLLEEVGEEEAEKILSREINKCNIDADSLTIIANEGMHDIPSRYIHGDLFVASSGSLDFGSEEAILVQYQEILLKLRKKLSEREWKKVYLIPTGHVTLALQIKNLVYQILRIDTIDLFYSKGNYYEINIDFRSLLL
jgi:hypothetical protein